MYRPRGALAACPLALCSLFLGGVIPQVHCGQKTVFAIDPEERNTGKSNRKEALGDSRAVPERRPSEAPGHAHRHDAL